MEARRPLVLVIDDDPTIRGLVASILDGEGYRVNVATNGHAGLEAMLRDPPDAVILDLQMPALDGWSFRAAQLVLPEVRAVPVIVLTAGGRTTPPAPDLAPTILMTKPFDIPHLLAALDQILGPAALGRRTAPEDEAPADPEAPPDLASGMAPA